MSVYVDCVGCEQRQLDTQKVLDYLDANGIPAAQSPESCDYAIIITCAVDSSSEHASLSKLDDVFSRMPSSAKLIIGGWLLDTPAGHPWLTQEKLSGGQLVEQTTHLFDLVRYLCGEASSIHCYGSKGFVRPSDTYDVNDATAATIQLKSGAVACIQSSWSAGFKRDIYLKFLGPDVNVEFNDWDFDAKLASRDTTPQEIPGEKDIFAVEDRAFLDAVKYNDASRILSSYEDGVRSLELSFAANESLKTGYPVQLTNLLEMDEIYPIKNIGLSVKYSR